MESPEPRGSQVGQSSFADDLARSQLVKFALVGTSGYVVNVAVYTAVLRLVGVHYELAAFLAFLTAVGNNYVLNRRWTFAPSGRAIRSEASRFLVVSLLGFALNASLLALFVGAGIKEVPAQILALIAAASMNFVLNRQWTFRPRPQSARLQSPRRRRSEKSLLEGAGLRRAAERLWAPGVLAVFPALVTVLFLLSAHRSGVLAADFDRSVWQAGRDVLAGDSPYGIPSHEHPLLSDRALYPPIFIFTTLPFALLPHALGVVLWDIALGFALAAGMWLLGVRDWRCYGIVALSWPVVLGLVFGNLSLALVGGVGLLWRYRNDVARAALIAAVLVAAKLFLWPLIAWLFVTRRIQAASLAVAATLVAVFVPWALIGFAGLRHYPELLSIHSDVWGTRSLSLFALGRSVGLGSAAAQALALATALGLLALAAVLARREEGERRALAFALGAALASSPIVWQHYLVLLIVLVALIQPTLGWLWAFFPAFWLVLLQPAGDQVSNGWQRLVVIALSSALMVLASRARVPAGRMHTERA
jgi:putative flippase GtrA